jgi:hypothetical protein
MRCGVALLSTAGCRMNALRKLNALSDAHPGKTLLAILAAFALACCMLPADPPSATVVGMSR